MNDILVRQPNGLIAIFSFATDSFTHMNLTTDQARDAIIQDNLGTLVEAADRAVRAGVEDWQPGKSRVKGCGLTRWQVCMSRIERVHGKAAAEKTAAEGSQDATDVGHADLQERLIYIRDDANPDRVCAMFVPAGYDRQRAMDETGFNAPHIFFEMPVPFALCMHYKRLNGPGHFQEAPVLDNITHE